MRDNRHHKMFHFSVFCRLYNWKAVFWVHWSWKVAKTKLFAVQSVCHSWQRFPFQIKCRISTHQHVNWTLLFFKSFLFFASFLFAFFSSFFYKPSIKLINALFLYLHWKSDMVVALKLIKFTTHFRCDFWLALTTCGWHWRSGSQTCCMRKIKEKTTHQ